jgi:hypothetical protein
VRLQPVGRDRSGLGRAAKTGGKNRLEDEIFTPNPNVPSSSMVNPRVRKFEAELRKRIAEMMQNLTFEETKEVEAKIDKAVEEYRQKLTAQDHPWTPTLNQSRTLPMVSKIRIP